MKNKTDKKTEQPELTDEVINAFIDAKRQALAALNKRLNKERTDE